MVPAIVRFPGEDTRIPSVASNVVVIEKVLTESLDSILVMVVPPGTTKAGYALAAFIFVLPVKVTDVASVICMHRPLQMLAAE